MREDRAGRAARLKEIERELGRLRSWNRVLTLSFFCWVMVLFYLRSIGIVTVPQFNILSMILLGNFGAAQGVLYLRLRAMRKELIEMDPPMKERGQGGFYSWEDVKSWLRETWRMLRSRRFWGTFWDSLKDWRS